MYQKESYYSLFTSNISLPENSKASIEAAEKAYEKFYEYRFNKQKITILYENNSIELKTILGKGGAKIVFDLGNGDAVALLNIQSNSIDVEMWNRLIKEEVNLSQKLRSLGLCTQAYEEITLYFDGYPTKALKMPNFAALATQGQQVRDIKNGDRYGTSLLFGNQANLQNPKHWQKILKGFEEDLIIYYTENLAFGSDTFNLAIVDSAETPAHDRTTLALFTERQQKVRFCFYDFSSKQSEYQETKYAFFNQNDGIERKLIKEEVDWIFTRVISAISAGLLPIEYVNILGGVHTLLLVSEDTIIDEVPDKTIILKKNKSGIHYAYFADENGSIKEKEIGTIDSVDSISLSIDLCKLAQQFFEPGEWKKEISINQNSSIIEEIAWECGYKQYPKSTCALAISELANKTALPAVKPLFIEAVTNRVIEKLTHKERENQFEVNESRYIPK